MELKDLLLYTVVICCTVIVCASLATFLTDLQSVQVDSASQAVVNESRTVYKDIAVAYAYTTWAGAPTVLDENNTAVPTSNYTYSASAGTITLAEGGYNNTKFNVSYTYNFDSLGTDYNVSGYGTTSLITFGEWTPTIALVLMLVVIVGVLIVYLAKRFL